MSSILSSREKKIIVTILNADYNLTLRQISDEIGVSRRTVMREMSSVYDWFSKRGHEVERSTSKGIKLNVNDEERKVLLEELNDEMIIHYYNKKERSLYIITELLQSKQALKLSYFSTVLGVSEASISSDLNSVEEWLEEYELTLERKQGYGVEVIGKERYKRRALVNIIYKMLDGDQLKSAVKRQIGLETDGVKVTSKISLKLMNMIDINTINTIEAAISNSEKEMGFKFTESSYTALAVHLALALKRITNHELISMNSDLLEELKLYDEFIVATKLIRALEEEMDVSIPDDEIGYVTLHLKGARYKNGMYDSSLLKFNEMIISNYELTSMINKMIKIASKETGYDLMNVDSLLIGLVDHLRPAINRMQLNLEIRNPLLQKIKEQYPEIFKVSIECSKVMKEQLNIELPESEIGYIAMHIGSAVEQLKNSSKNHNVKYNVVVTCISGIGTSKMLAERIKKEFKDINIVEVFASTNINDKWLERNDIDVILSTVYFENDIVPVVNVNPLLLENDISKIRQKLTSLNILRKSSNDKTEENFYEKLHQINSYSTAILELLDHLVIVSGLNVTSKDELIERVSKSMSTEPSLLEKEIHKREEIGEIVFGDEHVIFLHTRSKVVKHISVGIFRNNLMIHDKDNRYDTALVLIAPEKVEKEKLEILGEISARVVSEDHFLSELRNESEEGLYNKIQKFLNKYYTRQIK